MKNVFLVTLFFCLLLVMAFFVGCVAGPSASRDVDVPSYSTSLGTVTKEDCRERRIEICEVFAGLLEPCPCQLSLWYEERDEAPSKAPEPKEEPKEKPSPKPDDDCRECSTDLKAVN